jgi:DNA-binding NtrC family response regulator
MQGRCTLGSAEGCDIVIPDNTVSRTHAELALVPEGMLVQDLGSRNGTFYMGQRIDRATLSLGARLELGAVTVVVDANIEALQDGGLHLDDHFRGMIGASVAMKRLFAMLVRLEGSLVTVLIHGESGVGKELVAQAIHEGSTAADGPLVAVNCGAIPRDLAASELFGHKRGAFTGAVDPRKGAFESADGGTLLLDEIGELPLDVQPVLLRALETSEVRPVGESRTKHVRVRVLAATNRDLKQEVALGRFREDLYYRLAVVTVHVPALRERRDDIEPLARAFASAGGMADLPAHIIEQLKSRPWPGNVRELRNVMAAYTALGQFPAESSSASSALELSLGDFVDLKRLYSEQKEELCERFTRIYLQALMARANGNQSTAAKLAGLDRTYLGRLLAKHGLAR